MLTVGRTVSKRVDKRPYRQTKIKTGQAEKLIKNKLLHTKKGFYIS